MHTHCAGCHNDQGAGPFPLLSYDDASDHAAQIVEVVDAGLMPPWLPEPGYGGPFIGQRGLSEAQRERLREWVAADRPTGDLSQAPAPPPQTEGWQLGAPELVLEAATAYELPAEGPDVYQNFIIPLGPQFGDAPRLIRSVELRPGDARVVHHAVLRVDPSGAERARAGASGSFEGMVVDAQLPGGRFVGWTPGKVPDAGSDARAWSLSPAHALVLQLHLRPSGKPEQVRPRVGLHFASPGARPRPSLALILSSTAIDIPAGEPAYELVDTLQLPAEVDVLSVYPHAHYIAKHIEAFATLPGGERRWLLKIDDWDFNWQDEYRLATPVRLPAGSVVTMRHVYDNSADNPRNPHAPPQQVRFGPASTDEMAELILEVEPVDPRAMPALQQALRVKWLQVQLGAARLAVADAPEDPSAHAKLASLLNHTGDPSAAARSYADALARVSDAHTPAQRAAIRIDYAIVLTHLGQLDAARAELDAAEQLQPGTARVPLVRGDLEREAGEHETARRAYALASTRAPDDATIDDKLGHQLQALGQLEPACEAFARAVAKSPTTLAYHEHHARALEAAGDYEGARAAYEAALILKPDAPRSLRGLAWVFATHPDPEQRDAKRAIELAERAGELVGFRSPDVFEALAAALAADGQFTLAGKAIARGIELAQLAKREDLSARYREQAERYAARRSLDPQ